MRILGNYADPYRRILSDAKFIGWSLLELLMSENVRSKMVVILSAKYYRTSIFLNYFYICYAWFQFKKVEHLMINETN